MKHYQWICLVALFLMACSCGSAKRVAKQEVKVDSTAVTREASTTTVKYVDTTRIEQGKVTITEIEFFPPPPAGRDHAVPEPDSTGRGDVSIAVRPQPVTGVKVDLQNFGSVTGAVKSVRQTVIETKVEERGESAEVAESTENESTVTVERSESNVEKVKETTSKPFKWWKWLIFAGIGVLIVFIVLKRNIIFVWFRAIIATIRKIF